MYSQNHFEYYVEATQGQIVRDFSTIATDPEGPVAGLRLLLSETPSGTTLGYLGNPGYFVANRDHPRWSSGVEVLSEFLVKDGLLNLLSTSDFPFSLHLASELLQSPTKLTSGLLSQADTIQADLSRISDVKGFITPLPGVSSPVSKSVREALRVGGRAGVTCLTYDSLSSESALRSALDELRHLHYLSAGRLTRTIESWELQLKGLVEGHYFLTVARLSDGEAAGAALFLLNGTSAYYGVSANNPKYRHLSLSHQILVDAHRYARESGINDIWVGSQYSAATKGSDSKVAQIEQFKAYFGGQLDFGLLLSRQAGGI